MIRALIELVKAGTVTPSGMFPDLPRHSRGLPGLTEAPCASGCRACAEACPTRAITVADTGAEERVVLDLGRCIACGGCTAVCPTGTLAPDRGTRMAVTAREDLVLRAPRAEAPPELHPPARPFRRSLHVREVSTGDSSADLEVAAANNSTFDASRFGIHFVASPRHADALLVTGPVPLAMQEPLRRCYDAMAEPRLVIAAGAAAISGGIYAGGYASANGVDRVLPVSVYVPGNPPHPWYLLHALLLAMGHPAA